MRIGNGRFGIMVLGFAAILVAATGTNVTADQVRPVPLGGSLADQSGDRAYGVYVPTKLGGVLTVKTTSGEVERLTGPDGRPRRNGEEVGLDNAHGWYTFLVKGTEKETPYKVETTFVQVGEAARMPWNFYYWPTKGDSIHEPWAGGNGRVDTPRPYGDDEQVAAFGSYIAPGQDIIRPGANGLLETPVSAGDDSTWFPNLYDDLTFRGADGTMYQTPSPLLKFDQLFGTNARGWEAQNSQNRDINRWPGHCLGGAVASIKLNEPVPAPGSGMKADELKACWAELGENHYNHTIGDNVNNVPAGPPRSGYDPTDAYVPRFHAMLETHLRGRRQALLGNLRAFPPNGKPEEVWNHGVGKYTAKFHAIPGKGDRAVRLEIELVSNSGANLNSSDNKPRINTYEYTLVYGMDGKVDEAQPGSSDWIACGGEAMYCPLNLMDVVSSRWAGHNPNITESSVRALDMSNGGGFGRFASNTPPTFRPVGAYETGRPADAGRSMFTRNRTDEGGGEMANTGGGRRGGLFGGFFRGR